MVSKREREREREQLSHSLCFSSSSSSSSSSSTFFRFPSFKTIPFSSSQILPSPALSFSPFSFFFKLLQIKVHPSPSSVSPSEKWRVEYRDLSDTFWRSPKCQFPLSLILFLPPPPSDHPTNIDRPTFIYSPFSLLSYTFCIFLCIFT